MHLHLCDTWFLYPERFQEEFINRLNVTLSPVRRATRDITARLLDLKSYIN